MATAIVKMRVGSYEEWKPVFDEAGELRRSHGVLSHRVLRGAEDPNEIVVISEWPTSESARSFQSDPKLREFMQKAGVIGAPEVMWVGDETESAGS